MYNEQRSGETLQEERKTKSLLELLQGMRFLNCYTIIGLVGIKT